MKKTLLLVLLAISLAISESFHVQYFLKNNCRRTSNYSPGFRFHFEEVLLCKNVNFTEDFTEFDHFIKNEEVIVFEDGVVSVLNGDFFRLFPQTEHMIFKGVTLNLKTSKTDEENDVLETLFILSSKIFGNQKSKAFHELKELKVIGIVDTELEYKTIDKNLLEMNTKLEDVTFLDSNVYPPTSLKFDGIDSDALENAPALTAFYLGIVNMTEFPEYLLENKDILKELTIYGRLEKFPKNLPSSLIQLDLSFYEFDRLTRDNLKNLKDLFGLAMYKSNLRNIDEDAFDDLENLKYVNFYDNNIESLTLRHFENCKKLKTLRLKENIIKEFSLPGVDVDI